MYALRGRLRAHIGRGRTRLRGMAGLLLWLLLPAAPAAGQTDATFVGDAGDLWSDPTSWDIGVVPANNGVHYNVFMSGRTATLDVNPAVDDLSMTSSFLVAASPFTLTVQDVFTADTARLIGPGTLVLNGTAQLGGFDMRVDDGWRVNVGGTANVATAVLLTDNSVLDVLPGGVLNLTGSIFSAGLSASTGASINIRGTANFTNTDVFAIGIGDNVTVDGTANFSGSFVVTSPNTHAGRFHVNAGGDLLLSNPSTVATATYAPSSSIDGDGRARFGGNDHLVQGAYNVALSTSVQVMAGHTVTFAQSPTNLGTDVVIGGGRAAFPAGAPDVTNLTLFSTLDVTGDHAVTGAFSASGGTLTGAGRTTLQGATTGTGFTADGRNVTAAATATASGGTVGLRTNATLTNDGTLTNVSVNALDGTGSFLNNNLYQANSSGAPTISASLTQDGTVTADGAFTRLDITGPATGNGSFAATNGATLRFEGVNNTIVRSFGAGSSFTNDAASTLLFGAGTTNLAGTLQPAGPLTVAGGTLNVNSVVTVTIPTLNVMPPSGFFGLSSVARFNAAAPTFGTVNLSGFGNEWFAAQDAAVTNFDWGAKHSGDGTGTTTVLGQTTFGFFPSLDNRTLVLQGASPAAVVDARSFLLEIGATLVNRQTLRTSGPLFISAGAGANTLVNEHVIQHLANLDFPGQDAFELRIDPRYEDTADAEVHNAGVVLFNGGGVIRGTLLQNFGGGGGGTGAAFYGGDDLSNTSIFAVGTYVFEPTSAVTGGKTWFRGTPDYIVPADVRGDFNPDEVRVDHADVTLEADVARQFDVLRMRNGSLRATTTAANPPGVWVENLVVDNDAPGASTLRGASPYSVTGSITFGGSLARAELDLVNTSLTLESGATLAQTVEMLLRLNASDVIVKTAVVVSEDVVVETSDASSDVHIEDGGALIVPEGERYQSQAPTRVGAGGRVELDGESTGPLYLEGEDPNSTLARLFFGNSPGDGTLTGELHLGDFSAAVFELGGTSQGVSYDFLDLNGPLLLEGGALNVSFFGTFHEDVLPTDVFTIVDADSIAGTFANVMPGERLFTSDGRGSFLVHYGPGSPFDASDVVLSEFQVPEPGGLLIAGPWLVSVVVSRGARHRRTRRRSG